MHSRTLTSVEAIDRDEVIALYESALHAGLEFTAQRLGDRLEPWERHLARSRTGTQVRQVLNFR